MENNLFDYATSELSQDAFICWLCNWANFKDEDLAQDEKKAQDEKNLKELATEFIESMLPEKIKLDGRKVNIKKQYKKIDILLKIEKENNNTDKKNVVDTYIIIEDKIGTGLRNNQIEDYKNNIEKENKEENGNKGEIRTVYYKIWDESGFEEIKVDKIYMRKDILDLFGKYSNRIENIIFKSYYNSIEAIENKIKAYKEKDLKDWDSNCYTGFFQYLKNKPNLLQTNKEGCGWGYVPNSAGGFMGLWWSPLNKEECKNLVNDTKNENLYLQIEQYIKKGEKKDIIAVKYSVSNEKDEELEIKLKEASENRKKIYEKLKEKLEYEFYKKYFRIGKFMTVGYLEYDSIKDCEEKIGIIQKALKKIEI